MGKHPKRVYRNANKPEAYQEVVKKRSKTTKSPENLRLLMNPEDTPENPLTFHRLMEWLAWTGWVYGYVRKRISPMDAHLYEDYAQSVWLTILELRPEYVMEVWYHGKGKFVNFMKRVIDCQLQYRTNTYHLNKHFHHTHLTLTDEQWMRFEEGETDSTFIDSYPVKYNCPSGNRKKMVQVEHEEKAIQTDYESLIDKQIHPLIDDNL